MRRLFPLSQGFWGSARFRPGIQGPRTVGGASTPRFPPAATNKTGSLYSSPSGLLIDHISIVPRNGSQALNATDIAVGISGAKFSARHCIPLPPLGEVPRRGMGESAPATNGSPCLPRVPSDLRPPHSRMTPLSASILDSCDFTDRPDARQKDRQAESLWEALQGRRLCGRPFRADGGADASLMSGLYSRASVSYERNASAQLGHKAPPTGEENRGVAPKASVSYGRSCVSPTQRVPLPQGAALIGCRCGLPHPPSGYFPQWGKRDTVLSAEFCARDPDRNVRRVQRLGSVSRDKGSPGPGPGPRLRRTASSCASSEPQLSQGAYPFKYATYIVR